MTVLVATLVMLLCPLALRLHLGKNKWLSRPFTFFVMAAVVYHGLSEVLLRLTDGDKNGIFRPERSFVNDGMLVVAASLVLMTTSYLIMHDRDIIAPEYDLTMLRRVLDWRLLMVVMTPLVIATVHGAGYQASVKIATGENLGSQRFAGEFFVTALVMTTFAFVLAFPRLLVPALGVQAVAMALSGQRLEIVMTTVIVLILGARVGLRLTRRQVISGALLCAVVILGVTSSRAIEGRAEFQSDSGAAPRIGAILDGILHPSYQSVQGANGPLADAAYRLNANAFMGNSVRGLEAGRPPSGPETIYYTGLLAVPSAVFPEKLTKLSERQRSVKLWESQDMGMPQNVDFLMGGVGFYYPSLGLLGQLLFSATAGGILGLADSWALRRRGVIGFLALAALLQAALMYERGWTTYVLGLRAFLALGLLAFVWERLRSARRHHGANPTKSVGPLEPRLSAPR